MLELNRLLPPVLLLLDENKFVDDFIGDVLFCVEVENKLFDDGAVVVWNKLLELLVELNAEDDDEVVAFENRPPPPVVFVLAFEFVNKLPVLLKSELDWGCFENNPVEVEDDAFALPWLLNRSKWCLIITSINALTQTTRGLIILNTTCWETFITIVIVVIVVVVK